MQVDDFYPDGNWHPVPVDRRSLTRRLKQERLHWRGLGLAKLLDEPRNYAKHPTVMSITVPTVHRRVCVCVRVC